MEEQAKDASVLAHIQRLVAEEHRLFEHGSLAADQNKRLATIQVELDQCWDLLRQRRFNGFCFFETRPRLRAAVS